MKIFENINVLSLEQAMVAPHVTYRLAMDGMKVIRMEHPIYGDPNRMIGDDILGEERMNTYYLCFNAGKKAITLNLAEPEGQTLFKKLVKELEIDIFVTNQLPKNYKKLGVDYDALKSLKPDIIWLGITGFGPDSNEPAYDPILQARSGLMELTGEAGGDPQVLGIALPDIGTGEHAYGLLMKALFKRQVTGEGSRIDLAMFESSVSWQTIPIAMTASFGKTITRRGNTHEFFCPVSVYKSADGFIYLAVGNDRQWKSIVSQDIFKALDRPIYEKNRGRIKNVDQINREINEITQNHSSETLIDLFASITVPVSKITKIKEMIQDPLVEKKLLRAQDPKTGKQIVLAPPPHTTPFIEKNSRQLSFPPRFGEHNHEIYTAIDGYTKDKLADLKEKGII